MLSFDENYSINELARLINISPNGAYKILKKFEHEGILITKKIANIIAYSLNLESQKTKTILALAIMDDRKVGRVNAREEDLQPMKQCTDAAVLFGSYIEDDKKPNDLDVLFLLRETSFSEFKKTFNRVKEIIPIHTHEIIQTNDDLKANLKKKDPVIGDCLKKGIILWGHNLLLEVILDVYSRKNK
ncbi:hypothetical protein JXC34_05240 [Candidatus Woesearchaeota archaeon]|nr:hypothetical protein [Candidatus Woesearchaeota archaeon]